MVLYRKYRPGKFSEVIGQEHVVQTLQGALKMGKLAHAYLFAGPRGTGKTSLARILAKTVNCERPENYDACAACSFCREVENGQALDLIEIDAASNRGIDEIRALREGTRFSSMAGKHKIYVIDECHQLTKEASNALLKTIEEPPTKTLFVLATTEPHKVSSTIISRVQRFDFKKLSTEQITAKLAFISEAEKLTVERDLLKQIAVQAEGSLRDAESNLTKLIAFQGKKIDTETARGILGLIPFERFRDFFDLVLAKKGGEAVLLVNEIYESGLDMEYFTKGLLDYARKILVVKASPVLAAKFASDFGAEQAEHTSLLAETMETKNLLHLMNTLMRVQQELKISPIPQLPLEIAIAELTSV